MDKTINISVQNKVAMADGTIYICDNSDFLVEFDFDPTRFLRYTV